MLEPKIDPIVLIYLLKSLTLNKMLPHCYMSNATDTNYFTIFLQTADVALVFSK